ncbi:LADA_0C00804g1_1 [Lachancea dasiensis]|uniref:LADA_0C00804g1_1 n=1 Tax=Lachancea dasiensis TaxID=1072105 RepID=A0A1G4IX91_9SACH|nr:LADA_0C00804g1_1 [Lachancea dasiensis]
MSGSPIPQLVNISHALQSAFVQKLRSEVKTFTDSVRLSDEQTQKIDEYIISLESAFAEFTRDNEHIERRDAHVTAADEQLYSGLKTMYADYLSQLVKLKERSVNQEERVGGDRPVEYVCDELPYKQPNERKLYVDQLLKDSSVAGKLARNNKFLEGIVNLSVLDSTVPDNVQCYLAILRKVGYSDQEIARRMPHAGGQGDNDNRGNGTLGFTSITNVEQVQQSNSDLKTKLISSVPEEPKKKISFSKYLKKGDVVNEAPKRPLENAENGSALVKPAVKRAKLESNSSSPTLASILKTENNKKKRNPIRFVDDEKLLTVYGDELPSKGLIVSPSKLRKVLKPFRDGEPREITYSAWNNQKLLELSFPEPEEGSDIVDIKGGLVPCETRAAPAYRLTFTSFSKTLTKVPLEPAEYDDADSSLSQKPLIVRAFGKNCLLLQKDRGGIPYKRVPEVHANEYPVRPISN